ncbi:MAG: EamA family transporter [Nitriliruptor sp.]|nr:MAG: EamA family transporter [Nitriliruptor sp.]
MGSLLALLAAAAFGISDVTGAVAARKASALTVTLGIQAVGMVALVPALWLVTGTRSTQALVIGGLAGGLGAIGLVIYLRAMAIGPIGVISPVSALVGAGVPVGWGIVLLGEQVGLRQLTGILLGLLAVAAVAYVPGSSIRSEGARSVGQALIAGAAFGLFFVALNASPPGSGLWPLLGARIVAMTVLLAAVLVRRRPLLPRGVGGLVVVSGAGDMLANALFLAATRVGLLSLVSLLTSLYPVVALMVARWWLHERLTTTQAAGVLAALLATALLAGGG